MSDVKFGFNMLLWTTEVTEEHYPLLEMLKEMGYDGVEIPLFDYDTEKCAALGKKLDELGLERTAVTVRQENDNLISQELTYRQGGVFLNCSAVDCCAALGAKILCGPFHSALGRFSGAGPTDEEWQWGVEGMREVAEYAQTKEVTLAVEYLNRFECYFLNCAADTARFVKEVNHPNCRAMYDTFHAHIEEKDVDEAIEGLKPVHVHISENDRSTPGEGQVDWPETFYTLAAERYSGWLTVEAFGLALPQLAAATKIWRKMYKSEEQLAKDALEFMKKGWEEARGESGAK